MGFRGDESTSIWVPPSIAEEHSSGFSRFPSCHGLRRSNGGYWQGLRHQDITTGARRSLLAALTTADHGRVFVFRCLLVPHNNLGTRTISSFGQCPLPPLREQQVSSDTKIAQTSWKISPFIWKSPKRLACPNNGGGLGWESRGNNTTVTPLSRQENAPSGSGTIRTAHKIRYGAP